VNILEPIVTMTRQQAVQPQHAAPEEDHQGSVPPACNAPFDPIESAVRRHPGLHSRRSRTDGGKLRVLGTMTRLGVLVLRHIPKVIGPIDAVQRSDVH
jgi:hypothetical protein